VVEHQLIGDDIAAAVARKKQDAGDDMVIMGSGTIVAQLTEAGLIDEYQFVVHPVVLGGGRTLFEGVGADLALTGSRSFTNGNVVLWYEPVR
jgi:dihydrofolate reductase